jgi:serine/threonine protein kinase
MDATVELLWDQLARAGLVSAAEADSLRGRWRGAAGGAADDLRRFARWLLDEGVATEYQLQRLLAGRDEDFRLGPYKILDRVGRGRFTGVYKAVHGSGRVVAVKALRPKVAADAECLARFRREARLALRLDHPHVVRAFEAGQANGLPYLVMEHLEGETLEDVLRRRGRLTPGEAAHVIRQALAGLQHLHETGLVHRDLNPANLMLVETRPASVAGTHVKILDMGLGRSLTDAEDAEDEKNLTLSTGNLLGTPAYLAPEQARDAHAVDTRADIYTLGCVLYHAVAGQPPFPESNPFRQATRHAGEEARPLREFNPNVPDALEEVVRRMMAKGPAGRYQTPAEAAAALGACLSEATANVPAAGLVGSATQAPLQRPEARAQRGSGRSARAVQEAAPPKSPPSQSYLTTPREGVTIEEAPAVRKAAPPKGAAPPRRGRRLTRRDLVCMAVGAAVILLGQGFGWLLAVLLK